MKNKLKKELLALANESETYHDPWGSTEDFINNHPGLFDCTVMCCNCGKLFDGAKGWSAYWACGVSEPPQEAWAWQDVELCPKCHKKTEVPDA